jgi:hypothetical protein
VARRLVGAARLGRGGRGARPAQLPAQLTARDPAPPAGSAPGAQGSSVHEGGAFTALRAPQPGHQSFPAARPGLRGLPNAVATSSASGAARSSSGGGAAQANGQPMTHAAKFLKASAVALRAVHGRARGTGMRRKPERDSRRPLPLPDSSAALFLIHSPNPQELDMYEVPQRRSSKSQLASGAQIAALRASGAGNGPSDGGAAHAGSPAVMGPGVGPLLPSAAAAGLMASDVASQPSTSSDFSKVRLLTVHCSCGGCAGIVQLYLEGAGRRSGSRLGSTGGRCGWRPYKQGRNAASPGRYNGRGSPIHSPAAPQDVVATPDKTRALNGGLQATVGAPGGGSLKTGNTVGGPPKPLFKKTAAGANLPENFIVLDADGP